VLHLDDRWIWDFWLIDDGPDHHLFYLQAPRSLGDPERRHRAATIGHAVSKDLMNWELLPDALGPGPPGAWDDVAPWTGSIVRWSDRWLLFYTGTSSTDEGRIQRIGLAESDNLITWERGDDGPVIVADHDTYERFGDSDWFDESWRDPWILTDPARSEKFALICARANSGPSDQRGAIAVARSTDLRQWTVQPPAYAPGLFAQMEVPQAICLNGRWYLLFCTPAWSHSYRWRSGRPALTTTYYVIGTSPTGPYTTPPRSLAPPGDDRVHYAGKLHLVDGRLCYLATVAEDARGAFVGDLSDPYPVSVGRDGDLTIGPGLLTSRRG
jgi:beta-fructofuranosidase